MTAVATSAGAVSRNTVDWHAINWHKAHMIVRRLQARIVKVTQMGRWGKVHALQRLLTHAFSAKVLAVKRVTENQGKRTAGVDKIIRETPEQKPMAVATLRQHGYRALPLRRVYKQHLQSTRRNALPVKLIDGSLVMPHEDLTRALV
jgi:RNA-directed DNA polymerase